MMTKNQFYEQFHLQLTHAQREAVEAVNGPVLLLAVPGSGKTTVLVSRLGYMMYCRGIAPENILTLTYTVAATKDMAERFRCFFGNDPEGMQLAERLEFRTINGVCARIIYQYGRMIGKTAYELVTDEKRTSGMLSAIYLQTENSYATESDLQNVRTWISYIKNMMLPQEEIYALNERAKCNISDIYRAYNQELKNQSLMDYDDQMIYAYTILKSVPGMLAQYQERYRFICVDEAQDTSKIQHAIIALLAGKNDNLFMVGDEDQSIYGFRAAYPQALLSFEQDHSGARVLFMEQNFRSNAKIVEAADRFIQKNELRHPKSMQPARAAGAPIREIDLRSRSAQYAYLIKVAKQTETQTAVLFRDHESALPLIDLLEREGLPYRMRGADLSFFTNRVVTDLKNIVAFAQDPADTQLFMQIYYKLGTYLSKQKALMICEISEREGLPVLEAAIRYGHLPGMMLKNCRGIRSHMENLLTDRAEFALNRIVHYMGYGAYLERAGLKDSKLFVLETMARQVKTVSELFARLDELQVLIREHVQAADCPLILSTIHSSKGLEYEQVYLIDLADGIFPEMVPPRGRKLTGQDLADYEEERRLFYVGVTRAREQLHLFRIGEDSTFRRELLGQEKENRSSAAGWKKEAKPYESSAQQSAQLMQMKQRYGTKTDSGYREEKNTQDQAYREFLEQIGAGIVIEHKRFGKGVVMELDEAERRALIKFGDTKKRLDLKLCFMNGLLKV